MNPLELGTLINQMLEQIGQEEVVSVDKDGSGEMPDGSFVLSVVVAYGQKIKIVIEKVE